jgi:hypothetical protein
VLRFGADQVICNENGAGTLSRVGRGRWIVHARSTDGSVAARSDVIVGEEPTIALQIRLQSVNRVFGRLVDSSGNPVDGIGVALGPEPQRMSTSDSNGRFSMILDSESQRTLTIHEGSPGGIRVPIRRNEDMSIVVRDPVAMRRLRMSVLDETSLEPVKSGWVRVARATDSTARHWDSPFSCGEAWLSVPDDGDGSIRCTAFGYDPLKLELRDLEATRGHCVVRMRRAQHRPTSAVAKVTVRFPARSIPEWVGLFVARTGARWPSPRRVAEDRVEFYWPTASTGVIIASDAGGFAAPERFQVPRDVEELSLEIHLKHDGGRIRGRAASHAPVYLRDSGGRQRVLVTSSSGSFQTGQVAPGTYAIRAAGGDWESLQLRSGSVVDVDLTLRGDR